MLILLHSAGNHSNRLFQNLHFEAFCKEFNVKYINSESHVIQACLTYTLDVKFLIIKPTRCTNFSNLFLE